MKLHPPEVDIPKDDPFKHALFARKEFAESLTALLRNVSEGLVIFVNAPWGEGKTTFAKMWRSHLENREKLDVIYFDAYAADYFDDPFVSFTGEILELVKRRLDETKGVETKTREFREAAVGVLKQLGSLGVKVGLRSITMGAVDLSNLTALKSVGDDLAEGISEIGEKLLEKKIEGYAKEKEALAQFKKTLGDLAKLVRDEQGFPLTIIVDELDRCRPDFALQLLERIKHLFDVEGVAFVLLVNQEQIEIYIHAVYGTQVKATAYLQKFGTLFVDLPVFEASQRGLQGKELYCDQLFDHFGLQGRVGRNEAVFGIGALANHFSLTMRELERIFSRLAIFYASNQPLQFFDPFLIPLVVVAQLRLPKVFTEMKSATISTQDFFELTRLGEIKKTENNDYPVTAGISLLRVLLMSESELKTTVTAEEDPSGILRDMKRRFSISQTRAEMIPSICRKLEKFSFKSS